MMFPPATHKSCTCTDPDCPGWVEVKGGYEITFRITVAEGNNDEPDPSPPPVRRPGYAGTAPSSFLALPGAIKAITEISRAPPTGWL